MRRRSPPLPGFRQCPFSGAFIATTPAMAPVKNQMVSHEGRLAELEELVAKQQKQIAALLKKQKEDKNNA